MYNRVRKECFEQELQTKGEQLQEHSHSMGDPYVLHEAIAHFPKITSNTKFTRQTTNCLQLTTKNP